MTPRTTSDRMADAVTRIANQLSSPNVSDSNGEEANIVDAVDRLARAIEWLAEAIDRRISDRPQGDTP